MGSLNSVLAFLSRVKACSFFLSSTSPTLVLDVLVLVLGVVEQESGESFVLGAEGFTFAFALSESPNRLSAG